MLSHEKLDKVRNLGKMQTANIFKVRVFDAKSGTETTDEISVEEKRDIEHFFQNRFPNTGDVIHANYAWKKVVHCALNPGLNTLEIYWEPMSGYRPNIEAQKIVEKSLIDQEALTKLHCGLAGWLARKLLCVKPRKGQ